jgi:hypothetical protein
VVVRAGDGGAGCWRAVVVRVGDGGAGCWRAVVVVRAGGGGAGCWRAVVMLLFLSVVGGEGGSVDLVEKSLSKKHSP